MASKSKTSSKQAQPRKLPQMEAIITRHKSAQLKRQLREKQETIAKINQMTQLLTSPTTEKKNFKFYKPCELVPIKAKPSTKKVRNVAKTHGKRKQRVSESKESEEYYPNKLKRNVEAKKVTLKPKHELKLIGRTKISKRKLTAPQRGYKSPTASKHPRPAPSTQSSSSPSLEDMARLTDESESLNDEDWLEILTCPSPVWWEDPPDADYSEDAIYPIKLEKNTEVEEKKGEMNKTQTSSTVNDQIIIKSETDIPATKQSDKKFMNKRNKLENLLGNIKYKLGCAQIPHSDNIINNRTKNVNLSDRNDDKTEKINYSDNTINNIEINKTLKAEFPQNKIMDTKKADKGHDGINNKRRGKGTSESTEEDPFSNLRDDDLLNDLENMDIPIEPNKDTDVYTIDHSVPSTSETFLGSGKDFSVWNSCLVKNKTDFEIKKVKAHNINHMKVRKVNAKIIKRIGNIKRNRANDKLASKMNSKRLNIDTANIVSSDSLDTNKLSTKNFEKLKKYKKGYPKIITRVFDYPKMDLEVSHSNKKKLVEVESNRTAANKVKVKTNAVTRGDKSECMTVYKIISNEDFMLSSPDSDTITDKEQNSMPLDGAKNRLDLFYKKFKNTYQRRLKKPEIICNDISALHNHNEDDFKTGNDEEEKDSTKDQNNVKGIEESSMCESCDPKVKAIVVSNKNRVNYCLKCSCIFDTDSCSYCFKKTKSDSETEVGEGCESIVENHEKS